MNNFTISNAASTTTINYNTTNMTYKTISINQHDYYYFYYCINNENIEKDKEYKNKK
jgi:hypothetical protein